MSPLPRVFVIASRQRAVLQPVLDALAWIVAVVLAVWSRYDFESNRVHWGHLFVIAVGAAILQLVVGWAIGLYRGRWRFGSFEEVAALAEAVAITGAVGALVDLEPLDRWVPASAMIMATAAALVLASAIRYLWRLNLERYRRDGRDPDERVIVFGAGEGGLQALDVLLRSPDGSMLPVALLDDDPGKARARLRHLKVLGGRDRIGEAAEEVEATTLLIAIPSAGSTLIRELSELAGEAGLNVKVLPSVPELLGGEIGAGDIRPLSDADLLGRHVIDTEIDSIAGYIAGKRVLVTGAGGSIGSELCRQIHRFAPELLIMLDRDESALHQVQMSIEGRAMLDTRNLVVCDIRDREALDAVFAEHVPQVVFHAAALKHLPLLEMWPAEAVKTNVWGTNHVLDAAQAVGVERFVNISTDKAADPQSVLGYTKRLAEQLTAAIAATAEGTYLSVRFGNVLGSRGSVLTAFRAQIEAGGPVTVTHPDVERYFMTVEEAVQLVVQAGALGESGEVLVLDMGEPVKIADVAQRLVEQSKRPVRVVYTGLRPGEKLSEVLFSPDEVDRRPKHPMISHVDVPPMPGHGIGDLLVQAGREALVQALAARCRAGSPASADAGQA
ncbi:MAG TPA: nucleoside-diphosphate sugar epimerase/dehydratase [Acidimicrobiales bacterium]|nr:nucleoside-diphosphate sugar epimerase/dehydratase [Acidimicrobiales bacterium]